VTAPSSRIERATIEDLVTVASEHSAFWGERRLPPLHHPMLIHEFGDTAFVVRGARGEVIAYLFGLLAPRGVGYIHLVAVRDRHRREGLARLLYERFEATVRAAGANSMKAFTQPANTGSIAFHRSLGFEVREVPDYVGPGETRVVFARDLG
jgi:ribosomal protein S18 acetylase RimI-like enzyme